MKKYYAYMKTLNGYEKLGISCYSFSRKKAAEILAEKKNIPLKHWLKSYNVVSDNEIIQKITKDGLRINFYNPFTATNIEYKYSYKDNAFILFYHNKYSTLELRKKLNAEKMINFIKFMKSDQFIIQYVDIQVINEYDYPDINFI